MKSLKEKIEVMQAAEDGKDIERYVGPTYGWLILDDPKVVNYDWTNQAYRIKPEPLEGYVVIAGDRTMSAVNNSKEYLEDLFENDCNLKIIKVREVTE